MSSPDERPPACLHVDLDGARDIFAAHGWHYEGEDDPMFASGLVNALDFFDAEGARATFFAIARDLDDPRKRPLLEEIVRRGHEIASHTTSHRLLTHLSKGEKRSEIADSKARLEAELETAVTGFRAPGFAIDREALGLVAEAGYRYDSSLFPTTRDAAKVRLPRVSPTPHRPLEGAELIELPMPGHGKLPFPFHASYSLVLGSWYFHAGLRRVEPGAPLVLLFHLTDFADPLPSASLPNLRARVFTLSHRSAARKLDRCARMVERVRHDYEVAETGRLLPG